LYRLLKQRLETLEHCRVRSNRTPGIDEMRQFAGLPRRMRYENAVANVRELLIKLAPELFQDLGTPWRASLSAIEATAIIEGNEKMNVRHQL
jgi:hypothetical protein